MVTDEKMALWKRMADEGGLDMNSTFSSVLHYCISAQACLKGAVAEIESLQRQVKHLQDSHGIADKTIDTLLGLEN